MSGPTVGGAIGPSGLHTSSPALRPASSTGYVTWHVYPDAEDDHVLVGELTGGRTRDDAARQVSRL